MQQSSILLNQHITNSDIAYTEGKPAPDLPDGILFKGEENNAHALIEALVKRINEDPDSSLGFNFNEYTFNDYKDHIHYMFGSKDKDWEGVNASVFIYEELDEEGVSIFGDGRNPDVHWNSKLLLVITSSVVGVFVFEPNKDGLDDLTPYTVLDVDDSLVDNLKDILESEEDLSDETVH